MKSNILIVTFFTFSFCCCSPYSENNQSDRKMEEIFQEKYDAWMQFNQDEYEKRIKTDPRYALRSDIDPTEGWCNNPPFFAFVDLGPDYLPIAVNKYIEGFKTVFFIDEVTGFTLVLQRQGDTPDNWIWYYDEFPDITVNRGVPDSQLILSHWWNEREKLAPIWFKERYTQWKEHKEKGNDVKALERLQRIQEIGIDALPFIIEKIEQGDTELIPIAQNLANRHWVPKEKRLELPNKKDLSDKANKKQCTSWWEKNKELYKIPSPE